MGVRNLAIALPERSEVWRGETLTRMYRNLGWLLAEFAQMRRYSPAFVRDRLMRYEGLEHYTAAMDAGRGVLVLTGHLGAWELSSFVHSLLGRPMGMVIRRLDNPLVDQLVNGIRCMHGNRILHKDGSLVDGKYWPNGRQLILLDREAASAPGKKKRSRKR